MAERNIAVIGHGYWGKNLVRNFAALGALHTICEIEAQQHESLKSLYPDVHVEPDYERILLNNQIQGIVIAAPAVLHYSLAKKALLAGKDVLVEKPLALQAEDGAELVELAEKQKNVLLVGHLLEYHPAVIMLKQLIDDGELGKLYYVYSNRLNLGKFRTEENILWSFAPHDISVVLLLLGEMPYEVSAHGGYYLHEDIADVTVTNLGFKNGIRAHIFVSWLHPYKEQRLVVVGDKKMAAFNDTSPQDKLVLYSHEIEWIDRQPVPHPKQPETVKVMEAEPLRLECEDFLDCIVSRKKPRVDGQKGLQVLQVLKCCQNSLERSGTIVYLNAMDKGYIAHATSVIESDCRIGTGTKIWHFSHIMPYVEIGKNCVIGQNVFIGSNVVIGNNVKIENNVSVFEGVTLENGVFCGPSCVFTNVTNPRSLVPRKDEFKPTLVKEGATIGANATIVCGNTIGRYALVGAGAVVTKDIPDYAVAYGNPAELRGWVCECGLNLVFNAGKKMKCAACGKVYQQRGKGLVKGGT